jgi:hypothetical protein
VEVSVPVQAVDTQPMLHDLLGASGSDEEGYVPPGLDQPAAEIAADRAGTEDEDLHAEAPLRR